MSADAVLNGQLTHHNRHIKRVCVVRQLGGIGDVLCLSPVFRGLKERYGKDCKVTVATSWAYYAGALPMLFRHNPFIDEIARVEPSEFAPPSLKHYRWEFKNAPNDRVPHCFIDTDLVIDLNTICSVTETRQQPHVYQHRTDIWCNAAHVEPSCKKPILVLTPEEEEIGKRWCDENLGEGVRIGIQMRANDLTRSWHHAKELAIHLHAQGFKVVTFDAMHRAHDSIPSPLGMDIRRVAAVIKNLDVMVAPDSGLLHVAGTVGTPILGIFGNTEPLMRMREYAGSYTVPSKLMPCAPCWYQKPCLKSNDKRDWLECLRSISVDSVTDELYRMLEDHPSCPLNLGALIQMDQR